MISTLVTAIHVLAALILIGIVLLQHGKGASIGATFGGSSQTLFGPRGPASALAKITTGVAILFMVTSIGLSVLSGGDTVSTVLPEEEPAALPTALPEEAAPAPEAGAAGPTAAGEGPVEGPVAEPAAPSGDQNTPGEPSGG